MRKTAGWIAGILLVLSGFLFGQTGPAPSFRFLHENWDAAKDKHILAELKKYAMQPSREQKKEILKSMLDEDIKPGLYLCAAKHFGDAFDRELWAEYNVKIKPILDEEDFKIYKVDEDSGKIDVSINETEEELAASPYAFRCLDLDGDKRVDLILFNQVYFGPSPGLVFYGRGEKGFVYLFDCAGALAKIERIGDKLYFRYEVWIIDPSEMEMLITIAYDFKTKTCSLDSKLYYAQQTQFPKILGRPEPFELGAAAVLRFSPKIDNKENQKNANGYYVYSTTRTLYGNAVAEYPKSAGGFIIARENGWAFVAFNNKIKPTDLSLHHGMEPTRYDKKTEVSTPIESPCQYYCGWIEIKFLAKGN